MLVGCFWSFEEWVGVLGNLEPRVGNACCLGVEAQVCGIYILKFNSLCSLVR